MKSTNSSHIVLLIIVIAVTVIMLGLYGYLYFTVGASLDRALVAREAVNKEKSYQMQQESLTQLYEQTAIDRDRIKSFFVPETETVAFIEAVESLGKSTGSTVTLSSIVAEDAIAGSLGRISVQVEARGSWSAVMRTLVIAESLPYKAAVKNVRLDATQTSGATSTREWRLTFLLETVTIDNN